MSSGSISSERWILPGNRGIQYLKNDNSFHRISGPTVIWMNGELWWHKQQRAIRIIMANGDIIVDGKILRPSSNK